MTVTDSGVKSRAPLVQQNSFFTSMQQLPITTVHAVYSTDESNQQA